jgi:hypothetical protein
MGEAIHEIENGNNMGLEDFFPNLSPDNHRLTSNSTNDYNCIAWAVGVSDKWWDPYPDASYFWPDGIPMDSSLETVCKVFETEGYVITDVEAVETGFEKIAVYGDKDGFTHAARQLPNGKWTSKLGDWEDIEHDTLAALEGDFYGQAVKLMKRAKR